MGTCTENKPKIKVSNMAKSKKLDYVGKMILAPMVKIGTLPTRLLALDYGADLVYTEEIIDYRLLRSKRVANAKLETIDYIDKTDDTLVLRIYPKKKKAIWFCKSVLVIQTEQSKLLKWSKKMSMPLM